MLRYLQLRRPIACDALSSKTPDQMTARKTFQNVFNLQQLENQDTGIYYILLINIYG